MKGIYVVPNNLLFSAIQERPYNFSFVKIYLWDKPLEVKSEVQSTYAFEILIDTDKFLLFYSIVKAVMANIILCFFI